mgnify:CR=1 FL=1
MMRLVRLKLFMISFPQGKGVMGINTIRNPKP